MEKKWFIGIDISKKTLDVVIYVPTKKHADETNYERFLNKEEGYKSLLCWKGDPSKDWTGYRWLGQANLFRSDAFCPRIK